MRLRRSFEVALLGIGATVAPAWAQHPLMSLPLDDPAYVQLEWLTNAGCRLARISPFRPYSIGRIRAAVDSASADGRCGGPVLDALRDRFGSVIAADTTTQGAFRLGGSASLVATVLHEGEFRPLWNDVRATDQGTPPLVAAAALRASWVGGPRFVAVFEGFGKTHRRNDPRVRTMAFRRTSGVVDVRDAYLATMAGPLELDLGRSEEAWLGEGRESLVLSAHGPPIDRLRMGLRWRSLEARALFGSLSTVELDPERDSLAIGQQLRVYRFLAGHALTLRRPRFEVTVGETILLGRRTRAPDLVYLNPLMPFLVAEADTGRYREGAENNVVLFGAARAWLGTVSLAAELNVDDVQIDAQDRTVLPDQLAWRLSVSAPLPGVWPVSVGADYSRVDGYTYLRESYSSVYHTYDVPLGSELGPDADRGRVRVDVWPRGSVRMSVQAGRWRRGAQRIDDRPSVGPVGHAGEPYPTRTEARPGVQGAWIFGGRLDVLGPTLPLSVGLELARIDNVSNQPALPNLYLRGQLAATYRFRVP